MTLSGWAPVAEGTQTSLVVPNGTSFAVYPGTLHLDGDAVLFDHGPPVGVARIVLPAEATCASAPVPGRPTQYTMSIHGLQSEDVGAIVRISPRSVSIDDAVIPNGLAWYTCKDGSWTSVPSCGQIDPGNWTFVSICSDGFLVLSAKTCTDASADCVRCGPTGTPGCGCIQGEPANEPVDIFVDSLSVILLEASLLLDLCARMTNGHKTLFQYAIQEDLEFCAYFFAFASSVVVQITWKAPDPPLLLSATITSGIAVLFAAVALFFPRTSDPRLVKLVRLLGNVIFAISTVLSVYSIVTYTAVAEAVLLYPIAVLVSGFVSFRRMDVRYRNVATIVLMLLTPVLLLPTVLPSCPHQHY